MHWSNLAAEILRRFDWAILLYFLLVNSFYFFLMCTAALEMRQHLVRIWEENPWRILASPLAPRISILAPAYNEAATVAQSLQALLALQYPNLELVVVNDGSTDATVEVAKQAFALVPLWPVYRKHLDTKPVKGLYSSRAYPNLVFIDKENGGKADALNAGLNLATGDLVCAIDADTLIEPDALQRMVRPFLLREDVLAAGGTIRVANGSTVSGGQMVSCRVPRRILPGFQVVEYLRAFLFGRLGWNRLGGNLIISGAFGIFRRDSMLAIGGYEHGTVGEDMELVVRLRRHAYESGGPSRVVFVPDPIAWTEAPESLRVLARQRDRWHRGLAEVLGRHIRILFNPRYGSMGLIAYPYFVFVELLAPVIEAMGILGVIVGLLFHMINAPFAVLFFLTAYGYGMFLSLFTLVMEELSYHRCQGLSDRLLLLFWALFEPLGYRQLTVIWRLRGIVKFLMGRSDWGAMERRGFQTAATGK